jgi:uncharacterized protein (DUF433 family)
MKNEKILIDIGEMIVSQPDRKGGKPCITGTGITVHRIVTWYKQDFTPEQIADEYEYLNLAQIYAALAYYHANQAVIEAELAAEDIEIERLEQENYKARQILIKTL